MITKKIFLLAVVVSLGALNFSCTAETASETDETYNIGRLEISDERDT